MAAVKLVLEDNLSVSEVAKELSVHYNSLYRWISEYEEYGESAFPGHGSALYNSQYEIKKLKRENEELRAELELLKKFQAFLKKRNV
jgi:Transposase and inactivated derivatives